MDQKKLELILKQHKLWLIDCNHGECANLQGADLRRANLCFEDLRLADLRDAVLDGADCFGALMSKADMHGAQMHNVDMRCTDLFCADIRGADLLGADLDFSCLPLWCGSLTSHFDDRQLRQIAYHLVKAGLNSKNASDETKAELAKLIDFANGFHRAEECGIIVMEDANNE